MNAARQLKPLAISDMLDQAFHLYRANFVLLVSIVAVIYGPMAVIQIVSLVLFQSTLVVDLIQVVFIQPLISAALILAISRVYLSGSVSIAEAYGASLRRCFSLLGAAFLILLAFGIPVFVLGCGLIVTGSERTLLLAFMVPYGAYLCTRWEVVIPSIIAEDMGAAEGLRRSWSLTTGFFWRVLIIMIFTQLLNCLVTQLPATTLAYGFKLMGPQIMLAPMILAVLTQVALILALPFTMAVSVLLYYDLRLRKEGYDLELRAQEMAPV